MKKLLLVGLALLLVFVLAGCAAQGAFAQTLVALPQDAQMLILMLLTAGIAWVLTKINMGQYTQALAAAIAPIIIAALEMGLGMIPAVYDDIVLAVLHWLVLLISGSVGALVFFKRLKTPKTFLSG